MRMATIALNRRRRSPVPPIRILLVDDHEVVRMGLRAMLEIETDLRVVGEASDGGGAVGKRAQDRERAHRSRREREVLVLIAKGCTNREIAETLVISEVTARNHVSHILEKLGMARRSEAAAFAARLGLLEHGE